MSNTAIIFVINFISPKEVSTIFITLYNKHQNNKHTKYTWNVIYNLHWLILLEANI